MLELTILKVKHAGIEEAEKVFPYLEKCDVSGRECKDPETKAIEKEKAWEEIINGSFPQHVIESALQTVYSKDSLQSTYNLTIDRFLLKRRIPIWHVERHSAQESIELAVIQEKAEKIFASGVTEILEGRLEEGFKLLQKYVNIQDSGINYQRRDKNMAKYLQRAERDIRRRYSRLKSKGRIRFVVLMGAAHKPERYLNQTPNVIELTDDLGIENFVHMVLNGQMPLARLQRYILEEYVWARYIQTGNEIKRSVIEQKSDEELNILKEAQLPEAQPSANCTGQNPSIFGAYQ